MDLGCDEDILDERGDDGALADSLVTADTDSDWGAYRFSQQPCNGRPASNIKLQLSGRLGQGFHVPVAILQHVHCSLHIYKTKVDISSRVGNVTKEAKEA